MSGSHHRRRQSDDLSESQLLPERPRSSRQPLEEQETSQPNSSSSSPPATPSPNADPDDNPDLPLSLSTSTLLTTNLPTDARTALATVATTLDPPSHKVTVRFQAIGDAPQLKVKVAKVSASNTFATVVKFLRKKLYGAAVDDGGGSRDGMRPESLFCYVNSVFAPGLDEGVGNLFRCFKVNDELIVAYSRTPAFG